MGRIILPADYFIVNHPDGTLSYEDGFNGTVHTFQGARGMITDDPCIRVLLLEDQNRAAIVSMEIAQAPDDQIAYTKAIVSAVCGVDGERIWVHSTHQFGFMHRPSNAKKAAQYDQAMKNAVTAAAQQAVATFRPARLGVGTGTCHVGANRNILPPPGVSGGLYNGPGSNLETNPVMTILRFEGLDKTPIGFFMSYGVKPSALCTTGKTVGNRELNSEVTGHACKWMEEEFNVPCIFCMPAAGDQYPRETAQFHGFDKDGVWTKLDIGFAEGIKIVDKLGAEMGRDAICVAKTIVCSTVSAAISAASTVFSYPNKTGDGEIVVPAQVLTLGNIAFVGFKQEMDCHTERQIQAASPYDTTLLVSFLNGDGKYFGHLEAYSFNGGIGTSETAKSPFAKGAAEKFVEVTTDMLTNLWSGRGVDTAASQAALCKTVREFESMDFGGISWIVLNRQENSALVLSKDILECRAYHTELADITWETSTLRKYLNGQWLESTFTPDERSRILSTNVENPSNSKYGIYGGQPTVDRVFLLSLQEAEMYLSGNPDVLQATQAERSECVWWHLRSPGEAPYVAASVSSSGLIDYHGTAEGVDDPTGGIRPAMLVAL